MVTKLNTCYETYQKGNEIRIQYTDENGTITDFIAAVMSECLVMKRNEVGYLPWLERVKFH